MPRPLRGRSPSLGDDCRRCSSVCGLARVLDEPVADPALVPTYSSREAQAHVPGRVGRRGRQAFGGYPTCLNPLAAATPDFRRRCSSQPLEPAWEPPQEHDPALSDAQILETTAMRPSRGTAWVVRYAGGLGGTRPPGGPLLRRPSRRRPRGAPGSTRSWRSIVGLPGDLLVGSTGRWRCQPRARTVPRSPSSLPVDCLKFEDAESQGKVVLRRAVADLRRQTLRRRKRPALAPLDRRASCPSSARHWASPSSIVRRGALASRGTSTANGTIVARSGPECCKSGWINGSPGSVVITSAESRSPRVAASSSFPPWPALFSSSDRPNLVDTGPPRRVRAQPASRRKLTPRTTRSAPRQATDAHLARGAGGARARAGQPPDAYLPTALATVILTVLVYTWGTRHAGGYAGLFAGIASRATSLQQIATARWDGLFASRWRSSRLPASAWNVGRGWTLFWLAAAVSTLTKGPPLGVLGNSRSPSCGADRDDHQSFKTTSSGHPLPRHRLRLVRPRVLAGSADLRQPDPFGRSCAVP